MMESPAQARPGLTIDLCVFNGNKAVGALSASEASQPAATGGAVFFSHAQSTILVAFSVVNSTFKGNYVETAGGRAMGGAFAAVFEESPDTTPQPPGFVPLLFQDSLFRDNSAATRGVPQSVETTAEGGAVFLSIPLSWQARVHLSKCDWINNNAQAIRAGGGALHVLAPVPKQAVMPDFSLAIFVNRSLFAENKVRAFASGRGGAISILSLLSNRTSVWVDTTVLGANSVTSSAEVTYPINYGESFGGAIAIESANISVKATSFSKNKCKATSFEAKLRRCGKSMGGAIAAVGNSTVSAVETSFYANSVSGP